MLGLGDPVWGELEGGYRTKYDPRAALKALRDGRRDEAWPELWHELHHQGDVGLASYAAVPHLVEICVPQYVDDWNLYALIATIDVCREFEDNPQLPEAWKVDYQTAIERIGTIALNGISSATNEDLLASLFAIVAVMKSQPALVRLALLQEQERQAILNEVGWG